MNDLNRINIELLGKKHDTLVTTANVPREIINENIDDIVSIFYDMINGCNTVNHELIKPFDDFIYVCVQHLNDEKQRRHINMELDTIHEEDSEMDIDKMNRILYMSNDVKRDTSNGLMRIIRKNGNAF
jgi:hypothetical protein